MEEIFDQLSDPNLDDATKEALSDELDELSDTVQTQLNDGFYQGDLPTSDDFTLDEEFKVATPEEREAAKRGIDILDNDGNVYKNVNKIDEDTIKDIAVYKDDIITSDTGAVSYKKKYTIPLTSGEGEIYIQAPQIRNKNAYVVYQDNYQVMLNDSPLFTKIDKYSDEPVTFMTKTQAAKKVREAYKADLAKLEGRPYNAKALQTEDDWFTEAIEQEQAAEKVIEARKVTELPKKAAPTLEGIPSKVEPEVVKTSAPAYNKVEETTQMANKSTKTKKVAIGTGTNNTFDVSISSKSDKAILEDVIDQAQTKGLKLEDYSIYKQGTPEYNSILPEESILDDGTGATVRLTAENRDKKLLEAINYKLVDTKYGKFAIDGDSTVGGLRDVKDVVQPVEITPKYAMSHRPTNEGWLSSNMDLIIEDFYIRPQNYISGGSEEATKASKESIVALLKIKDKPDATITIYRAGPVKELNNGDWVTLSPTYAQMASKEEGTKVFSYKVKAKEVEFAGDDINEFGYFGQSLKDKIEPEASKIAKKETLSDVKGADVSYIKDKSAKMTANKIYKNKQKATEIFNMSYDDLTKSNILDNQELINELNSFENVLSSKFNTLAQDEELSQQFVKFINDNNINMQDLMVTSRINKFKLGLAYENRRLLNVSSEKYPEILPQIIRTVDDRTESLQKLKAIVNQNLTKRNMLEDAAKYDAMFDKEISAIENTFKKAKEELKKLRGD
jgi:hypothetical protein